MATHSLAGARTSRASFAGIFSRWYSGLLPALAAARRASPAADRSVADVYSAWLAQNPQFTSADVGQANIM